VRRIFFAGDPHLLFVHPPDSVISLSLLRTFGFSSVLAERIGDQRSSDESGKPGLRSPGVTGVLFLLMLISVEDVRRGLENDEFAPFFQPIVTLRTSQLAGF
jgi:hypothetical protein